MDTNAVKKSSSLEREVQGYLKPKYHGLFTGYVTLNEMGKSEALNVIVKQFFDNMPTEDQQRFSRQSKNSY